MSYSIFGSDYNVSVLISCWDNEEIIPCQLQAYQEFMSSVSEITASIETAIFKHFMDEAPAVRERVGPPSSAEIAPEIFKPQDLAKIAQPTDLLIIRPLSDPKRIVGLLFDCVWEPDLGLAIRIEDEEIIEVGPQDIVL
jgi:hypothetical protein